MAVLERDMIVELKTFIYFGSEEVGKSNHSCNFVFIITSLNGPKLLDN